MSKFRKWNLREPKFAKFPGGACPQSPLEARAFGANNYSLFSITWGWNLCHNDFFNWWQPTYIGIEIHWEPYACIVPNKEVRNIIFVVEASSWNSKIKYDKNTNQ